MTRTGGSGVANGVNLHFENIHHLDVIAHRICRLEYEIDTCLAVLRVHILWISAAVIEVAMLQRGSIILVTMERTSLFRQTRQLNPHRRAVSWELSAFVVYWEMFVAAYSIGGFSEWM